LAVDELGVVGDVVNSQVLELRDGHFRWVHCGCAKLGRAGLRYRADSKLEEPYSKRRMGTRKLIYNTSLYFR
jgi:hypothetical protein